VLVDLITVTILNITSFFKFQIKYNIYIEQAVRQIMFGNYTVTACNFFVIAIHYINVVLTPTASQHPEL